MSMKVGQTTRDRLIDASYQLARRQGFNRTSVSEVMKAAGVTKGSFFFHFPSKESLGLVVLKRDREEFLTMIDASLAAATPLQGIERFFAKALKKHRETGFIGGCLWGNTALEMCDSNSSFTEIVVGVFKEWTAKMSKAIRAGQACGQIRRDLPPEVLAQMIVASIEGGIMLSRLAKKAGPLKGCLKMLVTLLQPIAMGRSPGEQWMPESKQRSIPHRQEKSE